LRQGLKSKVLNFGVIGLAIASLAPLLGEITPLFELFAHFKVHYVLFSAVLALLALKARHYRAALVALVLMGMNGAAVMPFLTITAVAGSDPQIKLINLNLRKANPTPKIAIEFLRDENADIVMLEEVTPKWAKMLGALSDIYPHMLFCDDMSVCDLGLLSKEPWETARTRPRTTTDPGVIVAKYTNNRLSFTLVGTHLDVPTPAIDKGHEYFHSRHVKAFSGLLRSLEGPLVVSGDFNATPWSPSFNRIIEGTELTRVDGGLLPTWPVQLSFAGIPIDQILTTPEFYGSTMTTGPQVGSDHLPLIANLRVKG